MTDLTPAAKKVWYCKIGEVSRDDLPEGSDLPMRDAAARRYERITGREPDFIFSGWGATLTEPERAVVEDRLPDPAVILREASETLRGSGLAGDPEMYLLAVEEGQKALDRAHAAEAALDAERARADQAETGTAHQREMKLEWKARAERLEAVAEAARQYLDTGRGDLDGALERLDALAVLEEPQ